MNPPNEKVIESSKTKLLLLFLCACIFVFLGVWLITLDSHVIDSLSCHRRLFCAFLINNPAFIRGIGTIAVIFFGSCGLFGFKKLFDPTPGLILNQRGIIDNSSAVAAGFIPWSEITGFNIFQIQSTKIVVIKLRNPEKYIESGHILRRFLNRVNYQLSGSPISITSTALSIGFNDLVETCTHFFDQYGSKPTS